MADLRIDIASEFVGRKAFNDANKSVNALDRAVGKLGKQIASVFAAQKIYSFAKASAQAFMEDQKSAALLTNTVKNLGLAFAQPQIDDFIAKLEKTSGIVDENLRPAMQKLLTTTGSVAKSQEILNQAIDVSRGSGVDLATVSQDLANAYVGNTKGLKKYALGLTQAELKAMSFAQIQDRLNKLFSGASAAYLDTYAGKMDTLNVAADNAKETIGKGLFDAIGNLTSTSGSVQGLADAMGNVATQISNIAVGISQVIKDVANLPIVKVGGGILGGLLKFGYKSSAAKLLGNIGANKNNVATGASTIENYQMSSQSRANAKAKAAAEAAAAKRAKELAKAQTTQTKALKDQAALKKAQGVFDLQQIELVAALQSKLSDQDKLRVEAQLALLNDNVTLATTLTNKIIAAQDPTGKLGQMLKDLGNTAIADPFSPWLKSLQAIQDSLAKINSSTSVVSSAVSSPSTIGGGTGGASVLDDYAYQLQIAASNMAPQHPANAGASIWDSYTPNISVYMDTTKVGNAIANNSANGNTSFIDRNLGYFTN